MLTFEPVLRNSTLDKYFTYGQNILVSHAQLVIARWRTDFHVIRDVDRRWEGWRWYGVGQKAESDGVGQKAESAGVDRTSGPSR